MAPAAIELDGEGRRAAEEVADDGGGEAPEHERALPADHHEPDLGGQGHAERGEDEGRRPDQRVLPGERGREGTPVDQRVHLERVLVQRGDEEAEQHHGRREGGDWEDDGLRRRPTLLPGHTLPITPSTR